MTFQAWIPPAGEVVEPPVHAKTKVDVLFSDRTEASGEAGEFNWSSFGDGPKIIAYSVIEEYVEKREPREWWFSLGDDDFDDDIVVLHESYAAADDGRRDGYGRILAGRDIIHVREVLPEAPLDLTKNTTPFGLLDEATQAALKAHGGPYEFWQLGRVWDHCSEPAWCYDIVYRVAPSAAPAKPAPREVAAWAVVRDGIVDEAFVYRSDASRDQCQRGGTVVKLTGYL